MHFGVPERGVFPLVSMLGDLCPVVVGAALAFKRRREPRVALTFLGDGAMSTGDVHEGLNLAGVLQVPVVFVLQSNQFAYSTPTGRQMVNTKPRRADPGRVERSLRAGRRDGRPRRLPGGAGGDRAGPLRWRSAGARSDHAPGPRHAAHDDARYVPAELRARFGDPIERLAARLLADGVPQADIEAAWASAAAEVAAALEEAEAAPAPDPATLEHGVYATPLE